MTYRELVLYTLNHNIPKEQHLGNAAMGLAGEAGEVIDLVKKHMYQGHEIDTAKLRKELGDVRYYLELAAWVIGADMTEIEDLNKAKLLARFPNGFSADASINRKA